MNTTYYKKKVSPGGRAKYIPVSYYDSELRDSLPCGSYLVNITPGSRLTTTIDPELASYMALPCTVRDEIADLIIKTLAPPRPNLTDKQQKAWDQFIDSIQGEFWVTRPSAAELAREIIQLLAMKAKELKESGEIR